MVAVLVAAGCSVLASLWALGRLRQVAGVLHLEPRPLARAVVGQPVQVVYEAMRRHGGPWEERLADAALQPGSEERMRASLNEVLLELEDQLTVREPRWGYARVSVLGGLLAVAVLLVQKAGSGGAVLDIVAVAAAGVMISVQAMRQAERLAEQRRQDVDVLVQALLKVRAGVQGS